MSSTYVQGWTFHNGSAVSSISVTISGATANNLLVAFIFGRQDDISDAAAAGWTLIDKMFIWDGIGYAAFYRIATGDSNDDFAPSWTTGATEVGGAVGEFSGLATSGVLDVYGQHDSLSALTTSHSASTTPTEQPGHCVTAAGTANQGTPFTVADSFTIRKTSQASTFDPQVAMAEKGYSGTSEIAPTWTHSNQAAGIIQACFKAAAGGAASTTTYFIPAELVLARELLTPHTKPKHGTVRLKHDHFAVRDSALFFPFMEQGGNARSAVNTLQGRLDGTLKRVNTRWGPGLFHDGEANTLEIVNKAGTAVSPISNSDPRGSTGVTVIWIGSFFSFNGNNVLYSHNDSTTPRLMLRRWNSTQLRLDSNTSGVNSATLPAETNKLTVCAVKWAADDAVAFNYNGKPAGTDTLTIGGPGATAGARIGARVSGGDAIGWDITGTTLGFHMVPRIMSDGELAALYQGLWRMFEPAVGSHLVFGTTAGTSIPILYNHYRNLMAA